MSQYPPYDAPNRQTPARQYPDMPMAYPPPPFSFPAPGAHLPPLPPPPTLPPFSGSLNGISPVLNMPPFPPYPGRLPDYRSTPAPSLRADSSQDSYDPHQPSTAYKPLRPYGAATPLVPGPSRPSRPQSPPRRRTEEYEQDTAIEAALLTAPTSVSLSEGVFVVHTLPPSHLPVQKLVTIHRQDATDLHNAIARSHGSVWYASGSSRAAEGWSAAVEWKTKTNLSGKIMRGCLGEADALESEMGAICKAVEGFHELLRQSLKDGTPVPSEAVVFSDSQAAIVSVDTSSRAGSIRFEDLWQALLKEFPSASLTLLWVPRDLAHEGYALANKIATVASGNSFAKRKKEGTLPDAYRRPGGRDAAPPGSCQPGLWQQGDADPSRLKIPPKVALPSQSSARTEHRHDGEDATLRLGDRSETVGSDVASTIFVTNFPDIASAKDLGILFAQFGEIIAVDIYHVEAADPRFAHVKYASQRASDAAAALLHRKPIDLDSSFFKEHDADLALWKAWSGVLTVLPTDSGRLVPAEVLHLFPGLSAPTISDENEGHNGKPLDAEGETIQRGISTALSKRSPPSSVTQAGEDNSHASKRARRSVSAERKSSLQAGPRSDSNNVQTELPPEKMLSAEEASTGTQAEHQGDQTLIPVPPTIKSEDLAISTVSHAPPTPVTAPAADEIPSGRLSSAPTAANAAPSQTISAAAPQVIPIAISTKTRLVQLSLLQDVLSAHVPSDWITHSVLVSEEITTARLALRQELFETEEAVAKIQILEQTLASRHYSVERIDAFVVKVLGVLDGIAKAEELEKDDTKQAVVQAPEDLEKQVTIAVARYCEETREAITSFAIVYEYLTRGQEAQEIRKMDVLRRLKVLEGMVARGDTVSAVVRYLLMEDGE